MKEPKAYEACISSASLADTGFSYTLSLISGKYKMTILYTLMRFQVVRFNAMKKYIGGISKKHPNENDILKGKTFILDILNIINEK